MKSSADSLKKRHISVQVFKGYLRYIAEKHPTVDTNDLLLHCGLPRSYIEKNSNWVSITYSKLFTDRAIYLTGDADLPFKAGQHSIHADVIDVAILQFFMQFLNVHTIFKLLKRSFVFFNKIYVLEVLSGVVAQ